MIPYSILDLAPVAEGQTPQQALENSVKLAQTAEAAGYHRFWVAEHHNMEGIASSAPAVLLSRIGAETSTIRLGSGGVMLPNHAPLVVAEQFGMLASMYPGRIDLGLGRAPGGDRASMRALRRNANSAESFPNDVMEILYYLGEPRPDVPIMATPGANTEVPVWILGSSLFGAQLAAHLGLPYAFASHFAPQMLSQAIRTYRDNFEPSQWLESPYFMMAIGAYGADTDEEAEFLMSSQMLAFARLRSGMPGKTPKPVENVEEHIDEVMMNGVRDAMSCYVHGGPERLRGGLRELILKHQPDEVILAGSMHDAAARRKSAQLCAEAMQSLNEAKAA